MILEQPIKFLGATVKSCSQSGGNGNSPVVLSVTLVEDVDNGDVLQEPPMWSPQSFDGGGSFKFRGIVNYFVVTKDSGGVTANVRLTDPRDVLDGVTVIVNDVNNKVDVPNVLNVYGYWEDKLRFGGSLVTDLGMLWDGHWPDIDLLAGEIVDTYDNPVGLKPGIEALANEESPYSGGIRFRGYSYKLDLSGLPTAPEPFRINAGSSASLLQIITELCDNAACDFQVYLDDDTIKFRYLSRNRQQAPGTIANWIGSQKDCKGRVVGMELVNEVMNVHLVGGQKHTIEQIHGADSQKIWPFWGLDDNGELIWGVGDPAKDHKFNLPCSEIAELVGATTYPCSIAELRAASIDYDSWSAYLVANEPEKAHQIDVASAFDGGTDFPELFGDFMLRRDLLNLEKEVADRFGAMNESDYWSKRAQRIYDFVGWAAQEYLGRKFCVQLPFAVQQKMIPDSYQVASSYEVADGGWMAENTPPLGLPYSDIDQFMTDDGRFSCFVSFPYDNEMNLQGLSPESYLLANNTVYVKADADTRFYKANGQALPYVVITLQEQLSKFIQDPLGGIEDLAEMLKMTKEQLQTIVARRTSSFPIRIAPSCYRPSSVAIPLRSNIERYGPWISESGEGRTEFIVDEDLTPWTCGDLTMMEETAKARIESMPTKRYDVEVADVTIVGFPDKQVGEVLVEGGPSITSLELSMSEAGYTTSYSMRTYTPQFGQFSRYNAEKLKKAGVNARIMRANVRNMARRQRARNQIVQRAAIGQMRNASHAIQQRSPHECLMGILDDTGNTRNELRQKFRTSVSTSSPEEFLANIRTDDPDLFRNIGGMGMEGLLRPFSTNYDPENYPPVESGDEDEERPKSILPRVVKPWFVDNPGETNNRNLPINAKHTSWEMDAFKGSDIDLIVNGENSVNLHRIKGTQDDKNARPLGLRGPLYMTGWGRDVTGRVVPQHNPDYITKPPREWDDLSTPDVEDNEPEDPKVSPHRWPVGPVALDWVHWLGVWASPGNLMIGRTKDDIANGYSGKARLLLNLNAYNRDMDLLDPDDTDDGFSDEEVTIISLMGDKDGYIPAGTLVYLLYGMVYNAWFVAAANCP